MKSITERKYFNIDISNTVTCQVLNKQENLLFPEVLEVKLEIRTQGFPGGTVVKNPPANAGDTGSSPGPGRSHMPRSS